MTFPSSPSNGDFYTTPLEAPYEYDSDRTSWVIQTPYGETGIQGVTGLSGLSDTGIQGITGIQGVTGASSLGSQGFESDGTRLVQTADNSIEYTSRGWGLMRAASNVNAPTTSSWNWAQVGLTITADGQEVSTGEDKLIVNKAGTFLIASSFWVKKTSSSEILIRIFVGEDKYLIETDRMSGQVLSYFFLVDIDASTDVYIEYLQGGSGQAIIQAESNMHLWRIRR